MKKQCFVWCLFLGLYLIPSWGIAGTLGKIILKDGSQVYGEIMEMTEGMIQVKTLFHDGDPLKIKWEEVVGMSAKEPMTFVLSNGTTLQGIPSIQELGTFGVKTDLLSEPIPVQVASVLAIDPPIKKAVTYTGNLN